MLKCQQLLAFLTFMSGKNSILGLPEPEKCWISLYFHTYEQLNFILNWVEHEKNFITSGPVLFFYCLIISWFEKVPADCRVDRESFQVIPVGIRNCDLQHHKWGVLTAWLWRLSVVLLLHISRLHFFFFLFLLLFFYMIMVLNMKY